MHHVGAEDISDLYAFEKERKFKKMLRFKDLYHKFMSPELVEARPDWDNLSEDVYYLNSTRAEYDEWELTKAKTENLSDAEADAYKSSTTARRPV
ncbi:hypothetical protein J3459_006518 [Metarhizium acridum]|nr:hypothetical protein J3459_006518 [Metarhizium acridum]